MTFKELAEKAKMSENGLHNKFNRNTLAVKDLQIILKILDKKIEIIPCCPDESFTGDKNNFPDVNIPVHDLQQILTACNKQLSLVDNNQDKK